MLSIIVPVFNEEEFIEGCINSLERAIKGKNAELIFIDGGSTDKTTQICRELGKQVYDSPLKGRASQMNFGAEKSSGDVLYFLHADSEPPISLVEDIQKSIDQGYIAGCYRLAFNPEHSLLKLYAWFTRFDVDLFRFGDQSLFVKKEVFENVKGFDEDLKVMEDQKIISDVKKYGKFKIMDDCVVTSSRKYLKVGVVKLQLIFTIIVISYYLGVSQKVMSHFYSKQL